MNIGGGIKLLLFSLEYVAELLAKDDVGANVPLIVTNGFIKAMIHALSTIADTKVSRVDSYLLSKKQPIQRDVSSSIAFFGDLSGTCSISFPRDLAVTLVSKMLRDDAIDDLNGDVIDGVRELVSLTAGGAKAELNSVLGTNAAMSLPVIVAGVNHNLSHRPDIPCVGSIFELEGKWFTLEVAIHLEKMKHVWEGEGTQRRLVRQVED